MAYFCPVKKIAYYTLRAVVELFRFVPFSVLYLLSDGFAWTLHRVVGYRRAVIESNLRAAFPERSEEELAQIIRDTYRNLTDLALETIKGFTAPLSELNRRCVTLNVELANQHLREGRMVLMSGSHYCSWEWPCLTFPHQLEGLGVTVYKPLSNPYVNAFYNQKRARDGMIMVNMEETYGGMRRRQGEGSAWFMVSDQSPANYRNAHWLPFLNQETAFLPGLDLLSRKFNAPVLYFNVQRIRRGHYEVRFEEICTTPSETPPGEITRRYAAHIERIICERPANWLWSHKRWKRGRADIQA